MRRKLNNRDPYIKGKPGGPARMAAELQNRLVEMAQDFVGERGFSQQEMETGTTKLRVYNRSGDSLEVYSVVGIGPPLVDPTQDLSMWKQAMTFQSVPPEPDELFAIIQEDAPGDLVVDALMTGETHCYIYVTDVDDQFAGPILDDYTQLGSSGTPAGAEILFLGSPASPAQLSGWIDELTLLLTVDDASAFDEALECPFVITIEDEDILVTDFNPPDNQTWGVQRGYNGTTAEPHDGGTDVVFKEGRCLATIRFCPGLSDDVANDLPEMLAVRACF